MHNFDSEIVLSLTNFNVFGLKQKDFNFKLTMNELFQFHSLKKCYLADSKRFSLSNSYTKQF